MSMQDRIVMQDDLRSTIIGLAGGARYHGHQRLEDGVGQLTCQMKSWSSWDSGCPADSGNSVSAAMMALYSPFEGQHTPHACIVVQGDGCAVSMIRVGQF
eukprot:1160709-Pelagomonas_calceolata.AAC.13